MNDVGESRRKRRTLEHAPVGRVGDGEDMGRHLVAFLALVQVDHLLRVDGQPLVRVDHNAEQARVRLRNKSLSSSSSSSANPCITMSRYRSVADQTTRDDTYSLSVLIGSRRSIMKFLLRVNTTETTLVIEDSAFRYFQFSDDEPPTDTNRAAIAGIGVAFFFCFFFRVCVLMQTGKAATCYSPVSPSIAVESGRRPRQKKKRSGRRAPRNGTP